MRALMFPLYGVFFVISLAMLAVKIWALVDACTRPEHAFPATGKQTKQFWVIVLVLALVVSFVGFLSLVGLVAAIVYLVDVRPRVREIRRGGGAGQTGPYGPW